LGGRYVEPTLSVQSTSVRDQSDVRVNLAVLSAILQVGGLPIVDGAGTSGAAAVAIPLTDAMTAAAIANATRELRPGARDDCMSPPDCVAASTVRNRIGREH
jgi:hypothetical protein